MKKFTILAFALAICASANADPTLKMLDFGSPQGPGIGEPGMIGLGISPNGKYVCGTLENGIGIFIGELENDNIFYQISEEDDGGQLQNVNDQGLAIGFNGSPGITFDIDGVETLLPIPEDCKYVVGKDLSDDGSVQVGIYVGEGYYTYASYSKDGGIWKKLPMPDVDPGDYNTRQCGAINVSTDGKIILGYIGTPIGPACLWRLGDNGEYVADPIYDEYAKRSKEDEEHPFLSFEAQGMSPDGRLVLLKVCEYIEEMPGPWLPAIYNTVTEDLEVYYELQKIDTYNVGLHPTAIANDGTFVGILGGPAMNFGTFIMKAGETQAEKFTQAFPEYASFFELLDLAGYHMPMDISADGNYIIGNGWSSMDEDPFSPDAFFYFMTYVIDRGIANSVTEIGADKNAVPMEYYTIDGIRTESPVRGLNIIRMSDGSVRKVLK